MTAVLFSTSGVHGCYTTLEEIRASCERYGFDIGDEYERDDWPDDRLIPHVTFLIVGTRRVSLHYGLARVESFDDLDFLTKLRDSSHKHIARIGLPR